MWLCLTTHRGVHDAGPVGPDGVSDVSDVDCVQVLVVARSLHKYLKKEEKTLDIVSCKYVNTFNDFPMTTMWHWHEISWRTYWNKSSINYDAYASTVFKSLQTTWTPNLIFFVIKDV
jgi:hypothetical protein